MQKNVRWTWIAMLAGFVIFFGNIQYARSAPPGLADSGESIGYLENITFEKLKNKERVTIAVSKPSKASIDSAADNSVLVKMENTFIPDELRRSLGEGQLSNIMRVLPVQNTIGGVQWAIIGIALKEKVPYSVSQQGPNVVIDFNVATLADKQVASSQTPSPSVMEGGAKNSKDSAKEQTSQASEKKPAAGKYISLDFQDAKIKAVLRLLAETGGVSIVSGDDVPDKAITIHMKKVHWEQALDTILEVNGLAKKQMGDVISVMTIKKMKDDEEDRRKGEEDRAKAELTAREMEQKRLAEKGGLQQIEIEAKIVEATDAFVRNLGIQWGGVTYQSVGSTPYGVTVGTNPKPDRALQWQYPSGIPFKDSSGSSLYAAPVNMPALISSPAIGLVIGGASGVLEAQLAALETNNQGKIISSPRITTMDNVKATIKQGQQIPVVTPATTTAPATVTFKDALLRLEVKPKITDDRKISMEIMASKDSPNYSQPIQGNYPIDTNMIESRVVIGDGETIVIGGVESKTESKGEDGVPWLSKIPVLGWLFKSEATKKERKQLLIFVTPRIIKADAVEQKPKETTG